MSMLTWPFNNSSKRKLSANMGSIGQRGNGFNLKTSYLKQFRSPEVFDCQERVSMLSICQL